MTKAAAPTRPGGLEVLVGLVVLAIVAFGGGVSLVRLGLSPIVLGLLLAALSGVAGLAGFAAAFWLRLRSWDAFGVRRTTLRWILIGVGVGLFAFILKAAAILGYVAMTGDHRTIQDVYATGASGGPWTTVLAIFFLSVLTPIGEEFLFRGVVTSALLRYGPFMGVVGGALIFAIFHGINMIFPAAVVAGLAAGEVFRRSDSIWPAVVVHFCINLPTIPIMLLTIAR